MQIKKLEIKNFIGLSELKLDPGKINILTGHKGSGKTSVIEALEKAFTNKNRRVETIRHGEEEATIYIQTSDGLEIDRRIRAEKADYLKVSKPGENVPSTETFLKKLINGDIFRPMEFVQKSPDEQAKIILNMLEIPWTMDDIKNWFGEIPTVNYEAHILQILKQIEAEYYKHRENINREIRTLEAQVIGIRDDLPANYDGDYWRTQKVQEYYSKVAEAEENNRKIANARSLVDGLESRISAIEANGELLKQDKRQEYEKKRAEIREKIQFFKSQIALMEQELNSIDEIEEQTIKTINATTSEKVFSESAKAGNAREALMELVEIDTKPLQEKADEVARMQSYLRDYDRLENIIKEKLAPRQELSETLTARIVKARDLPMELLKIAAVPIPEIAVDGNGRIRIGQTLISDLSEGEQLELAFRVAKAQAGKLKVICLDGINKINDKDRAWIESEMATDEYQYFVTSTEDGDLKIEITEGK